jgi:hypothetical protein
LPRKRPGVRVPSPAPNISIMTSLSEVFYLP